MEFDLMQKTRSDARDGTDVHAVETARISSLRPRTAMPHETIPQQEELQAATHATLRAHATSDEAKALVAKLAAMVENHGVSTGSRKNRRRRYISAAYVDMRE